MAGQPGVVVVMVRAKPPFSHPNGQRRHQSRRSFRDDFTDQKNGGVLCEQQQHSAKARSGIQPKAA
jgi:hypothetical protein